MLSYFPQVRDEESTYSIFSRLEFALQPPNPQVVGKMLFNRGFEVGRLNFQGSFDYLCNNLPSKFTPELFLYNNTIFPLFIPFLSTEKQEKALKYFKGDYPNKVNNCLKIIDTNMNRTFIRVCKQCIREDLNIHGEPYFRRQHEIELNRLCYKHKTPLYEYTIFPFEIPRKYDDYYTVLSNSKEIAIPKEFIEILLDITKDINTIFTLNLENLNIETTNTKISNKIAEKGYSTVEGKKSQINLSKDFKKYYTEEFLDYIGYNFDVNNNDSWIRCIARKKTVVNPLKYILVIKFLFGSFEDFYQYNKKYSMFKQGPYPCLNTICPNYNKLVIKDILQINKSHAFPVATFKCEHCGFKYCRRGPDTNDNDIFNKTRTMYYGHLWHDKLEEYVGMGISFSKAAKILGSNSHMNFKNWSENYRNSDVVKTDIIDNDLLLENYRNEILNFIKETPNATKLSIYRFNPKAYYYLLKNDTEWIINTIKFTKKNETISKEGRLKNYWLNKDELLVTDLLKAISIIKSERTPYRRLTLTILEKYIGYYCLHQNINKLPKCSQILDKVCETILSYQKRRVDYIIKKMNDNGDKITIAKVIRNASLGTRANLNQEILNYVQEMLKYHTHGNIIIIGNNDK